jgi:outer membrane protein assembly factor BamB
LNTTTGAEQWSVKVNRSLYYSSPALSHDGATVYIGSGGGVGPGQGDPDDDYLYAVEASP